MKRSKAYRAAAENIDATQLYSAEEALALVKKGASAKFDETVEVAMRLGEARGHQLVHYEDFEQDGENDQLDRYTADHDANPAEILTDAAFRSTLIAGIETLPDREKLLMALYYSEELNLQ